MRWKSTKIGDIRVSTTFLIFPCKINNEYRWMEWVHIEQIYMIKNYTIDGEVYQKKVWHDVNWLDKWGENEFRKACRIIRKKITFS